MKHSLLMKRTILVASMALIPLILPGLTLAAPEVTEPMSSAEAQAQGLTQIAVGSAKDTMRACLGRIPQGAGAGQLMLAEGSCQQVENGRTMNQTSGTFGGVIRALPLFLVHQGILLKEVSAYCVEVVKWIPDAVEYRSLASPFPSEGKGEVRASNKESPLPHI